MFLIALYYIAFVFVLVQPPFPNLPKCSMLDSCLILLLMLQTVFWWFNPCVLSWNPFLNTLLRRWIPFGAWIPESFCLTFLCAVNIPLYVWMIKQKIMQKYPPCSELGGWLNHLKSTMFHGVFRWVESHHVSVLIVIPPCFSVNNNI